MTDMPADTIKARLRDDLNAAMRARRPVEVRVLRGLIAAIDNAEAVPADLATASALPRPFGDPAGEVPRRMLDTSMLHAIIEREIAERIEAARVLANREQDDRAGVLRQEAGIIARYLRQ